MTARKRIESMRVAATTQAAGNHLRQKFDASHVPADEPLARGIPVTQGLVVETSERVSQENNLRYIAVNLQEAGKRIQATNPPNAEPEGSGFNLKYELKRFYQAEAARPNNHINNIRAIREAKGTIMRTCLA